ncbi:MAG: FAD:protein FMN transferase [Planctomycetota bacterium]|jgi:thiamine biosynthesis lipoprotein ApbE/Na+-translocating ferredoxin:NAD+ oxidoreductase RnfG subunit
MRRPLQAGLFEARSIGLLLGVLVILLAPLPARGQGGPPPPVEDVYLTKKEALRRIFVDGERVDGTILELRVEEKRRIEERQGRRLFEKGFVVYRGVRADGEVTGYAIITEEIGKYQPITFVVGVQPDGSVERVAVMVYRESHGSEVKRRRFLAQFDDKSLSDPIRQSRDIINVAGATLSVRSITRGVRKVLVTVDETLLSERRRKDLVWKALLKAGQDGLGPAPEGALREARYAMGTVLEMIAFPVDSAGSPIDPSRVREAVCAAYDEVERIEGLLSTWREHSEVSRINRAAGGEPVPVSSDTIACLVAARSAADRSGGTFDPTRVDGGFSAIEIDPKRGTARLARPGLSLDLGGIGKGYALDRAGAALRAHGVPSALLSFGGQLLAVGPPPAAYADAWVAAVRSPEAHAGALGLYRLRVGSIATSATYERGGHIIDPRSGRAPVGRRAVTVFADSATEADALSTAIFVGGRALAARLTERNPSLAALVLEPGETLPSEVRGRRAPQLVWPALATSPGGPPR